MQVEKMRLGPNELVFSQDFLAEHKQILGRLSSITGMKIDKIHAMIQEKMIQ